MSESNTSKTLPADPPKPLVVMVGPTAVGKTGISIQLAERLDGEIVSADSRLFYRGMDIGTAKPDPSDLARVPHHLIDVADPDQVWSLTIFQSAAHQAIAGIHSRNKLPFLVGGTGQYLKAVIEGWEVPTQEPEPAMREALERWANDLGPYGLHERLARVDPQSAASIDARNVRRTIRALEVTLSTGRPFSEQRLRSTSPYALMMIGLQRPRGDLYERVDQRIDAMIDAGFVDEVRRLLDQGYAPDLPTMSAIGYREIVAYLRGEMTLEDAKMQMKRKTRRYVRQQSAWFSKKNTAIHWFDVGPSTVDEIESLLRSTGGWVLP